MARQQKHRQPIINAAVTLFRRQGYASTGLNEIADASNAPKGSLYYYFPEGKASIAVAAVTEAGERVIETFDQLCAECQSTADLLKAHARLLAGWMKKSGYRDGCPITTVLLELAPQERLVAQAGRAAYSARISTLRTKLEADGFPRDKAKRLAQLCTSALQGSLIQARVERSGVPILTTADELAGMLEMMLSMEGGMGDRRGGP